MTNLHSVPRWNKNGCSQVIDLGKPWQNHGKNLAVIMACFMARRDKSWQDLGTHAKNSMIFFIHGVKNP